MSDGRRPRGHGFTLLETALVLVIVGLLAAAVVLGRDLIHAAKVRRAISELQSISSAVNTFRVKYGQLPGDFDHASDIWTDTDVVDGDNSGYLDYDALTIFEDYNAWHHLSIAALIDQTMRPVTTAPDANDPSIAYRSALDRQFYHLTSTSTMVQLPTSPVSLAIYGSPQSIDSPLSYFSFLATEFTEPGPGPGMTPADAYAIDSKLDDGRPLSGRVYSALGVLGASRANCPSGTIQNTYNVLETWGNCALWVDQ